MYRGPSPISDYQRREDLNVVPDLLGLAASEGSAFLTFNASIERGDGEIPRTDRTRRSLHHPIAHSLLALRFLWKKTPHA
jgi:hypothetical protein